MPAPIKKEKEQGISPRTKQLIVVIIFSLALTGTYFWYIYKPLYKEYQDTSQKYAGLFEEVVRLRETPVDRKAASERARKKKEFEQVAEAFETIKAQRLATGEERLILRSQVTEIAASYGLKVKGQDPLKPREMAKRKIRPDPMSVKLKREYYLITLRGKYNGLVNFMEDLGSLPKLVTVEKIAIRQQKAGVPLSDLLLVI